MGWSPWADMHWQSIWIGQLLLRGLFLSLPLSLLLLCTTAPRLQAHGLGHPLAVVQHCPSGAATVAAAAAAAAAVLLRGHCTGGTFGGDHLLWLPTA